jgi:hypothetical protein
MTNMTDVRQMIIKLLDGQKKTQTVDRTDKLFSV